MSAPARARARGGQGGYEPRYRIRLRERRAVELSLQGWSQAEIARALQVSQPGVSKILKRAYQRMADEQATEGQWRLARLVRQMQHVQAEAARGWEASKRPAVVRRQRKVVTPGRPERIVVEQVDHERHGDPRCLNLIRQSVLDEWGLLQHGVSAPTAPAGEDFSPLTDAEIVARMRETVRSYEAMLPVEAQREARGHPTVPADPPATTSSGFASVDEAAAAYATVLEERRRRGEPV